MNQILSSQYQCNHYFPPKHIMKAIFFLSALFVATLAEPPVGNYLPPGSGGFPPNSGYPSGGPSGGGFPGSSSGPSGAGGDGGSSGPASYEFSYEVKDAESGNDFGHSEKREGDVAQGRYYVLLPDGRKQIVEYVADAEGYKPKITYEGEANTGSGGSRPGQNGGYPTPPSGGYPSPPSSGYPSPPSSGFPSPPSSGYPSPPSSGYPSPPSTGYPSPPSNGIHPPNPPSGNGGYRY